MGVNKQSARIKHHTSTTTGSFTVPSSEDFTDGSWDKWDLAKSEIGVNEFDETVSIRIGSSIYRLLTKEHISLAVSDETTPLTTGTAKVTFRMPYKFKLTEVRASLTTVGSTSGVTTIDINANGASILLPKLTIDYGEKTSTTAATAAIITTSTLNDDEEITIDIDGLSGGATEAGLKIYLIGYQI